MHRQNKKRNLWLLVGLSAIIPVSAVTWTGCKKEPTAPPPTQNTHPNNSQPGKVATDANESPKPDVEPSIPPQENLINIIKAAKTWGPAYQSWYGKAAPDFTLKDIAGKQHKLSDYKGKNVLLVFWAAWCPPCRMEVPDLIKLRNDIGEDKLAMLAISNEKPDLVKRFVEKQRINYTILLDTGNMPKPFGFMRVYGTGGVPCSFFIDAEGKIRLGTSGLITLNEIKAILQAI